MSDLVHCLTEWLAGTRIGLLELRTPGQTIILRQGASPSPEIPAPETPAPATIRAPSLGVFLHGHPLSGAALARPGQTMRKGDAVGLVRIGALVLPVLAPQDCVIVEHLAEDGSTIGYGTPLLRFQPKEGM